MDKQARYDELRTKPLEGRTEEEKAEIVQLFYELDPAAFQSLTEDASVTPESIWHAHAKKSSQCKGPTQLGSPISGDPTKMAVGFYGTPGFPGAGDVLTKQAAERFAEQLKGKLIDNASGVLGPAKQLRIVSARIEGTDEQGCVLAECEAVPPEESH